MCMEKRDLNTEPNSAEAMTAQTMQTLTLTN